MIFDPKHLQLQAKKLKILQGGVSFLVICAGLSAFANSRCEELLGGKDRVEIGAGVEGVAYLTRQSGDTYVVLKKHYLTGSLANNLAAFKVLSALEVEKLQVLKILEVTDNKSFIAEYVDGESLDKALAATSSSELLNKYSNILVQLEQELKSKFINVRSEIYKLNASDVPSLSATLKVDGQLIWILIKADNIKLVGDQFVIIDPH